MPSCRTLLVLVVAMCVPCGAQAYLCSSEGICSNLLVIGSRVLFLQGDQTLTVLDVPSGAVVARRPETELYGRLSRRPAGIVVDGYSDFALLSPTDYKVIWRTTRTSEQEIVGDRLIHRDFGETVYCRDLMTGTVLWKRRAPKCEIAAAGSRGVLLHRAGLCRDTESEVAMLDPATGGEVWRHTAPPGRLYIAVYLDSDRIYVATGTVRGKRSDTKFEGLDTYDLGGHLIASRPVSPDLCEEGRSPLITPFTLTGKRFYQGQVRPANSREPDGGDVRRWRVGQTAQMHLPSGTFSVHGPTEHGTPLHYQPSGDGRAWSVCLRDADGPHGLVSYVAEVGPSLVVATDEGQVYRLDRATGRTAWVYVCEAVEHMISFSTPHGLPPYAADKARHHREANAVRRPLSGSRSVSCAAVGSGTCPFEPAPPPVRVIYDPLPADPYKEVPRLVAWAWFGALGPLCAVALLVLLPRRLRCPEALRTVLCLFLMAALVFLFLDLGRASRGTAIAFKVCDVGVFVLSLVAIVRLLRQGQWRGALCALAILLYLGWYSLGLIRNA